MNENKKLMPERFSTLDTNMSLEKLILAKDSKEPITGKVVLWDSQEKVLEVDLGNGFIGILPIDDASIYPTLHPNGKLMPSLVYIVGKNVIVTVKSIDTDNEIPIIMLSRKETMLDAFNIISNSIGETVECCVTGISPFGVFVDIGNGISGLIHYMNLCVPRVRRYSELGFDVGDKIKAKITGVNDKFQVELNYKDLFENLAFSLNPDDITFVTILERHNGDGYFGYLNPSTPVLVDVPPDVDCNYGDKVVARVKNSKQHHPDKLNLVFVSFSK